ncbi:T9SS type A sorting domain-containing protein [Dokdonia sp.]|uniref:T9SS type A sorting domain-containing protein n=1 Tax=Dokdonia sp. TaxID=2024995 RepID=UPI0032657103
MKKIMLFLLFPFIMYGQTQIGQDIDGEAAADNMGNEVSLSSDGSVLAVGAIRNAGNGTNSGHVRVFENVGGTWTQIGQDIDGEAPSNLSGRGLSLSSDGSIVAIGANLNDGNNGDDNSAGHVRVFENEGGTWTQIGQDIDGENEGDFSGTNISLSSDGTIIAISSRNVDANGNNAGVVRIFEIVGDTWTQIGENIDGEGEDDGSGAGLSLSSDGSIVAIGAPRNDLGGLSNTGHVRVYENQGGTWTQIGQDVDGFSGNGRLGTSVSLSSDGTIFAAGAPRVLSETGIVGVYRNQGGTWIQIGDNIVGEATDDRSGGSVSLSSDGTIVAIGSQNNDGNGQNSGHVRIYKNVSNVWTQIGTDINGEDTFQHFEGMGLSLSSDSSTVAIGYSRNNGVNGEDSGSARVFDLSAILSTNEFDISQFQLYPNPASDHITINLENGSTLEKTTIYNSLGQIVKTSIETTISTIDLSKGMYIVEVLTTQGKASKKLIIE